MKNTEKMSKELIIKTLIRTQNQVIVDLKERISVGKLASDIDEDNTLDPEDYSHQNESVEMNQLLTVQLEKAENDLAKLQAIEFSPKSKIEIGALVKTNQFSFVIGIATFPFNVDGNQYVGISVDAPIYSIMKDKIEGETFSFVNNIYQIVSIN
jgi:transcription elongation factor GreA